MKGIDQEGRDVPLLGNDTESAWEESHPTTGDGFYGESVYDLPPFETLEELPLQTTKSSILDSSWNLTNSALGAGLYALPRIFAALGLLGGSLSMLAAGVFTYFSMDAMLRASEKYRKATYASCLQVTWGKWAASAVHVAVIACCGGFIVLYIIITCDIIVGNSEFTGILNDLFPGLSDPLPWYLSRTALITWITLASAPLLSAKSLHGMALTSAISVGSTILSVVALVVLALIAAYQGKLAEGIHWFPDPNFFGKNPSAIATHMLATLPVVLTAFSAQMSVHPILQDLDNYTPKRMRTVISYSFTLCTTIYSLAGAAGYLVFGSTVDGDVLASIQPEVVAKLFGGNQSASLAFVTITKVCVAVAMLTSIPINLWPMRADVLDLIQHTMQAEPGAPAPALSRFAFYTATYSCLAAIYIVAVSVTTMWQMIQLVGGTCCIFLAFIFPGMLAFRLERESMRRWTGDKVFGVVLVVVGVVLMAVGVTSASTQ